MESLGAAGKRGRTDAGISNGGVLGAKRSKEMESNQHGLGSKSKPCTKFFSVAGCPFGENCHFLHYVPGGYNAVAQMNSALAPSRNPFVSSSPGLPDPHRASVIVKTRICNKFNTSEGCKFGDNCRFAHGERELGKTILSGREPAMAPLPPMPGRFPRFVEPLPPGVGPAATFGASATAKISVDASLAGAIIGKGGVNTKQICRLTGAKLTIRDHDTDPNLRNIELEGAFDQIKQATAMVRELIVNVSSAAGVPLKAAGAPASGGGPGSNYKTKLCDNFNKGSCTFGERCNFAHGAGELRKSAA